MVGYIQYLSKTILNNKTMPSKMSDNKLLKNITKYGKQLKIHWT